MSRWSTMCAPYCFGFLTCLAFSPPALARTDTFRRTSFDTMVHWDTDTVSMLVDPNLSAQLGDQVTRALHDAAQAWDVGGEVPRVALEHDVSEADRKLSQTGVVNWVGMAESWTYGDKLAVTVSTFDAESGVMIAAQIWLNPHRVFELHPDAATRHERYDFQAVLTHELGHVLGLGEADDAPDATMYPTFYRGDTHQRTLSEVDEEAIGELYALAASLRKHAQSQATCASTMPGTRRPTVWPWLTMLALLVATRDSRRWRSGFRRLDLRCAGLLACVRTEKSLFIHGTGGARAPGTLIAQASVSHCEEQLLEHHIVKLARNVRKDPNDQPAVLALIHALRSRGELSTMAALLECWASVSEGAPKPELAVAALYCQLAVGRDAASARKLSRAALDLAPSCIEALLLLEQHADAGDRDELCNRYLAFLEHAPFHPSSPRLRVALIDKLVEAGRYDEAMGQVKVLPPSSSLPPVARDIERACSIPPMPPLRVA